MALGTPTVVHYYVKGDRREVILTVALDSSYPTGGYAVSVPSLGLPGNTIHNIQFEQANGYRAQYDYTNNKIMVYTSAGTQTTNATDLSAITALRLTVTGKQMALSTTEKWVNGFVVDTSTGNVSTTTSTAGAKWDGGFLRDPDGRLVVTS